MYRGMYVYMNIYIYIYIYIYVFVHVFYIVPDTRKRKDVYVQRDVTGFPHGVV